MFRETNLWSKLDSFPRKNLIIFSLLTCLLSSFNYGQNTKSQDVPDIEILTPNKLIARELVGQQKRSYQLLLSVNQYAKVTVEQQGIDVLARLSGIDGKPLAEYDSEMRPNGTETVEFVASVEGNYQLDISARYPLLPAGNYQIRLVELRTASEQDKLLQAARNLQAESVKLFTAGKYNEAQLLIEKAIEIRKKELGLENSFTASALTQLARIIDALGKYDEAEKINQQVLTIREQFLGAEHPDVAYTLNYLATNYNHKEDYPNAILFHQRALEIREKAFGQGHPIVAVSLINLGVIYDALGDKSKAEELYQHALKIQEQTVGSENTNAAVVLNNIGKIHDDLGEYKTAEPFLQRAVTILEKLFSPDNPRIFDALSNLAECYAGQGELDKSESLYQRILNSREKTVGSNHPLTAHAAYNLANLYSLKNQFEKAEPLYRRALEIRENTFGPDSPAVSEVLSALALLLAQKGDISQSLKLQQRANAIDERNINLNLTVGSERQKLAYLNSLIDRTSQSIFIQARFAPANTLAIELAATTVLQQKGRVLDAVSNNLIELRSRFNAQDQALLDNLNNTTKQTAELILNGPQNVTVVEHQSKIKTLTDERENLEDEISRRAAGFYVKSQPVTLQSIQTLIPSDSALIEFAVYKPNSPSAANNQNTGNELHYLVYVLRNQGEVKPKDLGDAKQIDAAIDSFRQALSDPKRKDVQQVARSLDEKVMQPIRAMLDGATHLLISPDGGLNLIPFEALVNERGRYLVEDYSFSYLTSGRDLLRMQTARASKSKPLVIANPSFGEPSADEIAKNSQVTKPNIRSGKRNSITAARDLSGVYFAPLSGTAQEARMIQGMFPEAVSLTGAQATKAALKQIVAPSILHIATHGFFLEDAENGSGVNSQIAKRGFKAIINNENPLLRSGLALAGANARNGTGDDGILTALEASGLNLWGTKLVVLSACDTGLGEVKNGEGVYGLRRAFVLAGAESLVMSLWAVSDYRTRELMTSYYKNLKQGMGRGAALRQVQLEMLKKEGRQHPFYWAGFIQAGEWANLDGKR